MATVISAIGNHRTLHTYQNNHHQQMVAETIVVLFTEYNRSINQTIKGLNYYEHILLFVYLLNHSFK